MPPRPNRPKILPLGLSEEDKKNKALADLGKEKDAPSLYPPFPTHKLAPKTELLASDQWLIEKSRFYGDFFRYSGYYQTQDAHSAGQQRYSDQYRRIEGQRGLFDEIVEPSLLVFPPELLGNLTKRPPTIHSATQFLTSKSLANSLKLPGKGDVDNLAGRLIKNQTADEGDEDEDDNEDIEESEQEEDDFGGDYAEYYEDDDENDGLAFGDDDEDVLYVLNHTLQHTHLTRNSSSPSHHYYTYVQSLIQNRRTCS